MISFFRNVLPLCCNSNSCVMNTTDLSVSPISSTAVKACGKNARREKSSYSKYTGSSIYESNLTMSNCLQKNSHIDLVDNRRQSPIHQNRANNSNVCNAFGNVTVVQDTYQQFIDKHYNQFYKQLSMDNPQEATISNKQLVRLEDIDGDLLSNQKIFIDAYGMKNALRCKRDCLSFFGPVSQYKGKVINDFVLNVNEEVSPDINSIFFVIVFDRALGKFYFKNVQQEDLYTLNQLTLNSILFYSFSKDMKLYNRNLIQYGSRGNLLYADVMTDRSLKLEFISKTNQVIESSISFAWSSSPILLGENCFLPGKDTNDKRVVGEIYYNKAKLYWMISDKIGESIWIGCDRKKIIINKRIRIRQGRNIFEMNIDESN